MLHLTGKARARSGSIPNEDSNIEFLYLQKQLKSALESLLQQVAGGISVGHGFVTHGLHAVRPSSSTPHISIAMDIPAMPTNITTAVIFTFKAISIVSR